MHDLVLGARAGLAAFAALAGVGVVGEGHAGVDLGAKGLLVELDRFIATAFEKQIGLDFHDNSCEGAARGAAGISAWGAGLQAKNLRPPTGAPAMARTFVYAVHNTLAKKMDGVHINCARRRVGRLRERRQGCTKMAGESARAAPTVSTAAARMELPCVTN
ncbi:exported hypothetical protein [Cupriavidus taiwanensis]|nr:exported hypothetical protein [Cupriavidus taiwanensis]SOY59956.1 exported hypothetical protein [Cupriavidus taiwanensis]SOY92016.1 exported hypothetical protein [Cupriavidus taiwanensis]SOZ65861.1 exported hypothetical protein [Cupriavidus taiwanensis]SOZ83543.1 exported hypothetical protein [Cupriavidus taiwanensis]